MVYLDNYLLTLNSKYASKYINGSAKSNVQFNFIGLLKDDADIIRTSLSVLNAQIPVSYYIITDNNNTFTYANPNVFVPATTITIPVGNYDANTLITYMNTQLSLVYPIVMSINSSTGILSMKNNTTGSAIRVYPAQSTSAEIFGIGSTNITAYSPGGVAGCNLVFPYPLNLLGVKKISIKSTTLSITAFSSVNNNYTDTICTIPADQPAFGMLSYTNQNDLNKNILKQTVIDKIDIQLLDENQNYLDMNNLDWTITICLSNERIDRERDTITLRDITSEKKPLELNQKPLELKPTELSQDEKDLSFLQE
jgi:hypothetical protein